MRPKENAMKSVATKKNKLPASKIFHTISKLLFGSSLQKIGTLFIVIGLLLASGLQMVNAENLQVRQTSQPSTSNNNLFSDSRNHTFLSSHLE
jgi:hypothetical protein